MSHSLHYCGQGISSYLGNPQASASSVEEHLKDGSPVVTPPLSTCPGKSPAPSLAPSPRPEGSSLRDKPSDILSAAQDVLDKRIKELEEEEQRLQAIKQKYIARRIEIVQEKQRRRSSWNPWSGIPMGRVMEFLSDADIVCFSCASQLTNEASRERGQLVVPHLSHFFPEEDSCVGIVSSIFLSSIQSLLLDGENPGARVFLKEVLESGGQLTNLQTLDIRASGKEGEFLSLLLQFSRQAVPRNTVRTMHVSGMRKLRLVGDLLSLHSSSLENVKLDYFVSGHEGDIGEEEMPEMPKLKSLVYDVADVTDISADFFLKRLKKIEKLDKVERIYLPHVQINGESSSISSLLSFLSLMTSSKQIVLRFGTLPLTIKEIISVRENVVPHLPAVCISDHFIVAMEQWADWWPKMKEVWPRKSRITGLSVFREQIDFEALGSSAVREWMKMEKGQKARWEREIAPRVGALYSASILNSSTSEEIENILDRSNYSGEDVYSMRSELEGEEEI